MNYTENNFVVNTVRSGRFRPSDPYRTHGAWVAAQAQYGVTAGFALGFRGRVGSLARDPVTTLPANETVVAGDRTTLDPALGDPPAGASFAALLRFLPGRTAIDLGATISIGSFRPRWNGDGLTFRRRCSECYGGQEGFEGLALVPTLRVSRTGSGFAYAVGTGEGFVQTNEPGPIEVLAGWRFERAEVLGGFARGLALRNDWAIASGWWLGAHLSAKPWGEPVPGHIVAVWIFALGVERRFGSFAPL
jgi:hypothetical protein